MDEHIHRSMFVAILLIGILISGIAIEHARHKITAVCYTVTAFILIIWWFFRVFIL